VQFLTLDVSGRITAVPQIGWHDSGATWLFVLPRRHHRACWI
jgi:hypothetical protein